MNTLLSVTDVADFYDVFCQGLLSLEENDSIKIKGISHIVNDVHHLPKNTQGVSVKAFIDVYGVKPQPTIVCTLLSGSVIFSIHLEESESQVLETVFSSRFEKNKDLCDFNLINRAESFTEKFQEVKKLMDAEVQTFEIIKNSVRNKHPNIDIL